MAAGKKLPHRRLARFRKAKPGQKIISDARSKLKKTSILRSGTMNQVTLFTSHFDARNRIKGDALPERNPKRSKRKRLDGGSSNDAGVCNIAQVDGKSARVGGNTSGTIKTLPRSVISGTETDGIQNASRKNILVRAGGSTPWDKNAKRVENQDGERRRKSVVTPSKSGYRDSTYTGKSIQVSAENELALLRGGRATTLRRSMTDRFSPKQVYRKVQDDYDSSTGPSSSKSASFSAKVVISNLHSAVTEQDLLQLFGTIGDISSGFIKNDGTAEVTYTVVEDAFTAYSKYHGRTLDGQTMILNIAPAVGVGDSDTLSCKGEGSQMYSTSYYSAQANTASINQPVEFTVKLC